MGIKLEGNTTLERISAKKIFKNSKIGVKITTFTRTGIGYDIINVEDPIAVISDVENIIAPALVGYPISDQDFMDSMLCDTSIDDPTTTMGVSMSIARASANTMGMPLFKYLGGNLASELPIMGAPLMSDNLNKLIAIPMIESIGESVHIYTKILSNLSDKYPITNQNGEFLCNNVFDELDRFKTILSDISEEEDVQILVGASIETYDDSNINELDYLESSKMVEFDGTFATDGIDEAADFSIIEPYSMGTLTEMYHYINYVSDKGLTPTMVSNNNSFAHVSVGLRVPFIRSDINSNVLNELWNIERILGAPNMGRF